MVTVHLATALICFMGSCYPALVGKTTPVGEFVLEQRLTDSPGYSGDVLKYTDINDNRILAIHRLWLLKPEQKREERIQSSRAKDRVITAGCINVTDEVYEQLVECCAGTSLTIVR